MIQVNTRKWILLRLTGPLMMCVVEELADFVIGRDEIHKRFMASYGSLWMNYLIDLLTAWGGILAISEGNLWMYMRLEKSLPWEHRPGVRFTIQLLLGLGVTAIVFIIVSIFSHLSTHIPLRLFIEEFAGHAVLFSIFVTSMYIGIFFFQRMKTALLETERLKQESLLAQNQVLRQQIDPHFLFNNINTLSSLIAEDQKLAIEFVRRLSNVYRYVLQSKDYELINLKEELDFIRDYAFAFHLRFGDNFSLATNVPEAFQNTRIPPLTLQILVENCVKHNIISRDKPLRVSISVENNSHIVVRNNLQRKSILPSRTHVGLKNIITRYEFVTQKMVQIEEPQGEFIVKLPLLNGKENK